MPTPAIERFAAILLTQVRDAAIDSLDALLKPQARSPKAVRWRQKILGDSRRELAEMMIPDCVDDTLFYLLHAIDEGVLELRFATTGGRFVDLTGEGMGLGEMAGWFAGSEDGWKGKFSNARWIDDFKDMKLPDALLKFLVPLESHKIVNPSGAAPEIEEFAELLLREVRDVAIASCDSLLEHRAVTPKAVQWRRKIDEGLPRDLAELMIPDCVDETLFYLVQPISNRILKLWLEASRGEMVNLTEESEALSEMADWFAGSKDGWLEKFSKERPIEIFNDLETPW